MPATTDGGWGYVLPDDHPVEFPAQSQALANSLEAAGGAHPGRRRALMRAADLSVAHNVSTKLASGWNSIAGDTGDGVFTYAAGILTVHEACSVNVTFAALWDPNSAGTRRLDLIVIASGALTLRSTVPGITGVAQGQTLTQTGLWLPSGATLQCQVTQSSGAALKLLAGSHFHVERVSKR